MDREIDGLYRLLEQKDEEIADLKSYARELEDEVLYLRSPFASDYYYSEYE